MRKRDDAGAIAIIFAILSLTLFVVAGFVVDLGFLRDGRLQAQTSSDAAALAAGTALFPGGDVLGAQYGPATAAAERIAYTDWNVPYSAWTTCTDAGKLGVYGSGTGAVTYTVPSPAVPTECISFTSDSIYTHIRVLVPSRIFKTAFGGLAGTGDQGNHQVQAVSGAQVVTGGSFACGLCIVGGGTHSIGNGDIRVTSGAGIDFNGSINSGPNSNVSAYNGPIKIQGTITGSTTNWYSPNGAPVTNSPRIDDPLNFLTLPPSSTTTPTTKADPCNDGPGVYGSFRFSSQTLTRNSTSCTLQSGTYIIAGSSSIWSLASNGSANVNGTGVTLYFTCGGNGTVLFTACPAGGTGASLDLSGGGTFTISGPTSGPNYGLTIVYDRNNTSTLSLVGNGAVRFSGTVYAVAATLVLSGNGCTVSDPHYDSLVVVGDMTMNGNNPCLYLTYNSSHNVQKPESDLHLEY